VHRNGGSGGVEDLHQNSRRGTWDLGVYLVRRDLKKRLIALDPLADLNQPLRNRSLCNRFPHLGHDDIRWHPFLLEKPETLTFRFILSETASS
jgi:hypothetical protein